LIDAGDETVKVIASDISPLSEASEHPHQSVHFMVDISKINAGQIESSILCSEITRAVSDGFIHLLNGQSEIVIYLGSDIRLSSSIALTRAVDSLLGTGTTRYL